MNVLYIITSAICINFDSHDTMTWDKCLNSEFAKHHSQLFSVHVPSEGGRRRGRGGWGEDTILYSYRTIVYSIHKIYNYKQYCRSYIHNNTVSE